ncbi:MAG: FtsQ-type POTRA domain-containing protein [Bacteroidota bacterium]
MAKPTKKQQARRRALRHSWLRRVLAVLGLTAAAAVGVLGWQWQAALPVRAVDVSGTVHADTAAVLDLVAVPDSARLFALDPAIVADRARRHPWVQDARVTRWPTGTLGIAVTERVPVALVLDAVGRAEYFFDAAGFRMPVAPDAAYDVPLLSGSFGPFHPTQPSSHAMTLELLAALAAAPPETDALVSFIERSRDGSLTLTTAPLPDGRALPAALGRTGFTEKFSRLHAFWHQALLTRPQTPVRRIDLRFGGQIVTE